MRIPFFWNLNRRSRVASLALVLLMPVATSAAAASLIRCQLTGKDGIAHHVDFRYDSSKHQLFWIQGNKELKLIRDSAQELWASLNARASRRAYDLKDFRYDRGSGRGKFIYFRKLTSGEVKACKDQNKLGCDSLLELSELTQSGKCIEKSSSHLEN